MLTTPTIDRFTVAASYWFMDERRTNDFETAVIGALTSQACVIRCRDFSEFELTVPLADCAIVALPWLRDARVASRLYTVRRRAPMVPIVILTTKDADNALVAVELRVDALVWLGDIRAALASTVARTRDRTMLRAVGTQVQRAAKLPRVVRDSISQACRQGIALRSVAALAELAGVGRSRFGAEWQRAAPSGPTPKEFLDWLLLLSGCSRKSSAKSWAAVAREVGVDEDTLRRVSHRLTGVPLSNWTAASILPLYDLFRETVLFPLGVRRTGVP